jgi:exfoliative toxin A/B
MAKTRIINNFADVPAAVAGLASGVAGLGAVLSTEVYSGLHYITVAIASLCLLLILTKKIFHPKVLWREISHPVVGSFLPTFDMALMVVAASLVKNAPVLGQALWYCAIAIHIIFMVSFFYYRAKDFNLNHMVPSWFVPPIGIVVACVTGSSMQSPNVTHALFYFGFTCYCFMLPIMLYRLIFGDRIPDSQLPSFAIMGAPASLCLAGYLSAFDVPNPAVVHFLLPIALMMTALVYISMIRINHLRIKFTPIYAAFTFPLAIGANAVCKYAQFIGIDGDASRFWHAVGMFELFVATVAVLWVLLNMTIWVFRTLNFQSTVGH